MSRVSRPRSEVSMSCLRSPSQANAFNLVKYIMEKKTLCGVLLLHLSVRYVYLFISLFDFYLFIKKKLCRVILVL